MITVLGGSFMGIKCLVDRRTIDRVEQARRELWRLVDVIPQLGPYLISITGPLHELTHRKWEIIVDQEDIKEVDINVVGS